ncbi:DUF7511 domain-containing protein [Halobellus sp. EA9]|uniref:DUF7511 domain-containing protein n=1 Tax=Halobellus sp. EA9 TaxID=3421647 RepID=UPI003EB79FC5
MSDPSGPPESRSSAPHAEHSAVRTPDGRFELRCVVVRYERRPDRCTVYPRRESCCEHVDAWFSADADAFVPLDEMR